MTGYTAMLNAVVKWLCKVYDLRPKDLDFNGYDYNCYEWLVNQDVIMVDEFKGTVIVDDYRTILDLNNLQLNIISMDDDEEIKIKDGKLVKKIIAGILTTDLI